MRPDVEDRGATLDLGQHVAGDLSRLPECDGRTNMKATYGNSVHGATVDVWPMPDTTRLDPTAHLITRVEVRAKHRGKGVASALMMKVLRDADREQVTLYLTVDPDGTGLDFDSLWRWYERLGFKAWDDDGQSMWRPPKKVNG
jgi:GNAT superfamily N-acetyltransferase